MGLEIKRIDGGPERTVVIAAITNKHFLGQLAAKWKPNSLPSRWSSLVVDWCVAYYREWGRSPGLDINVEFDLWRANAGDPETEKLVAGFLESLSDEYRRQKESVSVDYTLEVAARLINATELRRTIDKATAQAENGQVEDGYLTLAETRPVQLGPTSRLDLRSARADLTASLEQKADVVINMPGALGSFFGRTLERDAFVALMAPEKRGKSHWLLDISWRAAEQGRKVYYFESGDNSKHQVLRRVSSRAALAPLEGDPHHNFLFPDSIEAPAQQGKLANVTYEKRRFPTDLDPTTAIKAIESVPGDIYLSVHPNTTLTVPDICEEIEACRRDGWNPDVVTIDYADILASRDTKADPRERINGIWKALRAVSQKYHCLVLTATQTDAASYDSWLLSRKNFSDDKRKYGHVTAMFGINQWGGEKAAGVFRLNWLVNRFSDFSESDFVYTAGNLAVGAPAMVSTF